MAVSKYFVKLYNYLSKQLSGMNAAFLGQFSFVVGSQQKNKT